MSRQNLRKLAMFLLVVTGLIYTPLNAVSQEQTFDKVKEEFLKARKEYTLSKSPDNLIELQKSTQEFLKQSEDQRSQLRMQLAASQQKSKNLNIVIWIIAFVAVAIALSSFVALRFKMSKLKYWISLRKEQESTIAKYKRAVKLLKQRLKASHDKNQKTVRAEKSMRAVIQKAHFDLKNTQVQLVQAEKMASLGQLTAGIAHEINNPINFVHNGIVALKINTESITKVVGEMMTAGDDEALKLVKQLKEIKYDLEIEDYEEEVTTLLSDINYGCDRTIEIVKGLRIFSRLDEEERKEADIHLGLDTTLVLLGNLTKNRVKVIKYYDENLLPLYCYPGQLNQVFMNLLSNAIQAIPEQQNDGTISIFTEQYPDSVQIRISDNGEGIPKEVKERIFEPFFTTKEVGQGTGLGLSIAYSIVEKHGGKIDLRSEKGEGTEFTIVLPRASASDDQDNSLELLTSEGQLAS